MPHAPKRTSSPHAAKKSARAPSPAAKPRASSPSHAAAKPPAKKPPPRPAEPPPPPSEVNSAALAAPLLATARLDCVAAASLLAPLALLDAIRVGAVGALRGSFVGELAAAKLPLPRREDAPASAFWTAAELQKLYDALCEKHADEAAARFCKLFVMISARWLSKDEPDPQQFHLRRVADAAKMYIKSDDPLRGVKPLIFTPLGLKKADFCVFWDYASLFQGDGADARALHAAGTQVMGMLAAHQHTVLWIQSGLPPRFDASLASYEDSGWCHTEASLSALLKPSDHRLDLARRDKEATYAQLVANCLARRPPPSLPESVAGTLRREKKFSVDDDLAVASALYDSLFKAAAPAMTELRLANVGWTTHQLAGLAANAAHFPQLRAVDLSRNKLTAAADGALLAQLVAHGVTRLELSENKLHQEAKGALAASLAGGRLAELRCTALHLTADLATLEVTRKGLNDGDALLVASAMGSFMRGLTLLDLAGNQLAGVDGGGQGTHNLAAVQALFSAIAAAGSLSQVILSSNNLAGEIGPIKASSAKVSSRSGDAKVILVGDRCVYRGRSLTVTDVSEIADDYNIKASDLSVVRTIGDALCRSASLTACDLKDNGLGSEGKRDLGKITKSREAGGLKLAL
ncbi:hypothetical protein AB1Y20_012766 [Prymnesium parvum]|uniref:Uncharacterized protein n=1 Tax=Prymnesium parvum TaxID=97485 RepID=A0AB34IKA8_PRYPA